MRRGGGPDAFVRMDWDGRRYRFVVECKRLWTPKALSETIEQARRYARPPDFYPLVVVPYLPASRLTELETAGVSGIDLCGNGVVVVPKELLVYRSGCPNQFRSEDEIKNVFRGNSSLAARVFLLVPEYKSVQAAEREIQRRGGSITLPTVSKVCKSLESMLVIERKRGEGSSARQLRLLQPDKLLDLLETNYVPPAVTDTIRGKTKLSAQAFREKLKFSRRSGSRMVQTGFGSVGNYAVMATEPMQYFYASDIARTLEALGDAFEAGDRFANIMLSETKDHTVYFDERPGFVASPLQAYLELARGDKRSKETATQIRRAILEPLERLLAGDR
ncbi:hypothetical protein [Singulisphaera acidiphila]|uniref:hypothetical protein n=1 Tax=Singulisphaera acidiphila TaxID=466153 RepID=UPI000379D2E2|nr:hypothetical protein [Singulisphaera acidiphila]